MTELWKSAIENAIFSWPVLACKNYIHTMTEIVANTFDELMPIPNIMADLQLGNRDLTVLMTACFSMSGFVVSIFILYCILKLFCWICFGKYSSNKGLFKNETFFNVDTALFFILFKFYV